MKSSRARRRKRRAIIHALAQKQALQTALLQQAETAPSASAPETSPAQAPPPNSQNSQPSVSHSDANTGQETQPTIEQKKAEDQLLWRIIESQQSQIERLEAVVRALSKLTLETAQNAGNMTEQVKEFCQTVRDV